MVIKFGILPSKCISLILMGYNLMDCMVIYYCFRAFIYSDNGCICGVLYVEHHVFMQECTPFIGEKLYCQGAKYLTL